MLGSHIGKWVVHRHCSSIFLSALKPNLENITPSNFIFSPLVLLFDFLIFPNDPQTCVSKPDIIPASLI